MEKCAIFIDGGYLDKILEKWKDFSLDYEKLVKRLCDLSQCKLLRVYYYNCLPIIRKMHKVRCYNCKKEFEFYLEDYGGRKLHCKECYEKKKKRNWNFLGISKEKTERDEKRREEKERFFNKLKKLHQFEVKYGDLQIINGQFKQKLVDVKMSLDIVDKCFDNQITHAIIIAGDSDFIPAIMKAKDCGAIVHLVCSKRKINRKLMYAVDTIKDLKKSFMIDFAEK
jgi:uncharacterized LabA/DUF88 family protein